jgi:carbamate kinase
MGPKVEAALFFLERGGEEVVVCRPEALMEAWNGRAGTRIRRDRA